MLILRQSSLQFIENAWWECLKDIFIDELSHVRRVLGLSRFVVPSQKSIRFSKEFMREFLHPRRKRWCYISLDYAVDFLPHLVVLISGRIIDERDNPAFR